MKKYRILAEMLFEMELERLTNETPYHFESNGWDDEYGARSREFVDELRAKPEDVKTLSKMVAQDFDNGVWEPDEDGLYNYEMPSFYADFITEKLSLQLALLTGVGYQTELNF